MKHKIKKFFKRLVNAPALNLLLKNSMKGWPNSQLELAKFYLFEIENYIEAYAWAEVAYCRKLNGASDIKSLAQEKLQPTQIKEAWDLARIYKQSFIPPLQN